MFVWCVGLLMAAGGFVTEVPALLREGILATNVTEGAFVQEKKMRMPSGGSRSFKVEGTYRIRPGKDFLWVTERPFKTVFHATRSGYTYSNEDETTERGFSEFPVPVDTEALSEGDFSVFFKMFDALYKEESGRFFVKAKPKDGRLKRALSRIEAEGVKGDWVLVVVFVSGDELRIRFKDRPARK